MDHIVKPIVGLPPEPQQTEVVSVNETIQPEKVKPGSPWSESQIRSQHVQQLAEGQPIAEIPLFSWTADLFGLDEDMSSRDTKILQSIIELARNAVGDNPTEILKFISKGSHDTSGPNKHKTMWRTLMLAQKAYKEVLDWGKTGR